MRKSVRSRRKYLAKGSTVYLEGSLQTRKWTDQQGVEKYSTEIVLQVFSGKMVMLSREVREPATTPGCPRTQTLSKRRRIFRHRAAAVSMTRCHLLRKLADP